MITHSQVETPIGPLSLAIGARGLTQLSFGPAEGALDEAPAEIASALSAYFEGDLAALDELPVDPNGTAFQLRVWRALRRIPAGETWSYAQLAREIGQPTAMRAVGAANGKNPIAIVIPCHRVIAADGTLGGYSAGLWRKEWLLAHERVRVRRAEGASMSRWLSAADRSSP